MLKKTITYVDYNGEERKEDFYFNLSKAEVMEMELSTTGGLAEMIQRIVAAKDAPAIIKIFKDLVLKAYGEKSVDGRRIDKPEEISRNFMNCPAYDKLFEKLTTDANYAYKFLIGLLPKDLAEQASKNPEILKLTAENGISVE